MRHQTAIQSLSELGFTALEAEIYLLLLRESPATGYRIAQGLGKPTANVYKALESLEQKGAIEVEEGPGRSFRPIDPEELLAQADRRFRERREQAARVLAGMRVADGDQKLYSMRGHDQVFERARAMLERAEKLVVIDVFPPPFAALRPAIEAAVARGVDVAIEVYEPVELPGADVVVSWSPEQTLERWPGDALHMVVDAREWLIALFAHGESRVIQACWTASPFLAATQYTCLASDFLQMKLRRLLVPGTPRDEIDRELARYDRFRLRNLPGYAGLLALAGPDPLPQDHDTRTDPPTRGRRGGRRS